MATLYELAYNVRDIIDALDNCDTDEEIQHLMKQFEAACSGLSEKAETYVKVMRNMQTDIDAVKSEVERLKQVRERREKVIERMKDNLRQSMDIAGVNKIQTTLGTWTTRMSPWSVEILDENVIDDRFKLPQPPKVSKKLILDEFNKTGEIFPGVEISKREYVMFK